ncbi:unnamed protein product [marine sediment metagenome]|uniref:Uncharacterized protein n=1 Tax=marine sediment metagenome TaxID=412755 RepID=X1C3B3_9ZZZZ
MTIHEYTQVMRVLEESGLGDIAGFKIDIYHDFTHGKVEGEGNWDIILTPLVHRIFLIPEIVNLVKPLDVDLAVFTDINRPGCLIFH